jgi:RNA polymerase sigma-70 factor (ECF subfamily)
LAGRDVELELALERARNGDEEGFAILWRTLHPPVLRYLRVRSGADAEDVAAETWLQVIKDLSGFNGGVAEFRAWLFTVARNRAIDRGRTRTARPAFPMADPGEVAPERSTPSAETAAEDRAATEAALRLVATLPPDQAELVMLRVVAGLDVTTVAAMVDKTPGAVRVAVHRALKSLSQHPEIRSGREVV